MHYFLAKTDPDTYSIDDFAKEGETLWDGVHNNAAILFIQQMHPGDMVYIYESMSTKAIVGLAEVTSEPFLNTADPRRSWAVTMKLIKKYNSPLSLATIKATPSLANFALVRQSRLSVMPVPADIVVALNSQLQ
jgi:predicted RNA-binding protein with PUA-like domain